MAVRKFLILGSVSAALLGPLRLAPLSPPEPSAAPHAARLPAPAPATPFTPEAAPPAPDFPAVTTSPVLPETASPGVLSHWHGRLRTPLRDRAPAPDEDLHLPLRFAFPLSASRAIDVRIDRHDETGPDSGVFTGETEDPPGGVVILSYVGLAQAGVVQIPDERRAFVINGDEQGRLRITTLDLDQAPGCTPPLLPPAAPPPLASLP